MAQINNKAVRSLSKLMEAGFDSEKAVMAMTMDSCAAGYFRCGNRDD